MGVGLLNSYPIDTQPPADLLGFCPGVELNHLAGLLVLTKTGQAEEVEDCVAVLTDGFVLVPILTGASQVIRTGFHLVGITLCTRHLKALTEIGTVSGAGDALAGTVAAKADEFSLKLLGADLGGDGFAFVGEFDRRASCGCCDGNAAGGRDREDTFGGGGVDVEMVKLRIC